MYHETWRIERDFLYDPHTHGLSIAKIEARYKPYLDGLSSRSEFTYLSTEMLGEITIGHMFVGGPYHPDTGAKAGLLGADYKVENGRYRIAKILGGQNWTPGLASPLTLPGVSVREGEYLLAVNGRELKAGDNLYEFFDGTSGKQTVLRVGPNADGKDARDVTAVPISDEDGLRNLDWIEGNRRKVGELSGGCLLYTSPNGKYLYFLASTDDGPSRAGIDLSSLDRAQTSAAYVVVLAKDGASPVPPESDDEKIKDEARKDDTKDADKKEADKDKKDSGKKDSDKDKKDADKDKKDCLLYTSRCV